MRFFLLLRLYSLELFHSSEIRGTCFSPAKSSEREENCLSHKHCFSQAQPFRHAYECLEEYLWYSRNGKIWRRNWIRVYESDTMAEKRENASYFHFIFRKRSITKSSLNMRENRKISLARIKILFWLLRRKLRVFHSRMLFAVCVVLQHETLSTVESINISHLWYFFYENAEMKRKSRDGIFLLTRLNFP